MIAAPLQQPTTLSLAQAPCPHADDERREHMKQAWKAYRGKFQKPLKVKPNQPDDNVISNRCAPIVDKGVSFLFGQVLKIEATNETATPDTKKQTYLDGVWGGEDERMTLLSQLAINGGVCGQPFAKLVPVQGRMKYPRVVVLDPMLLRMVTHPDDCSLVLAYIIEYPASDDWEKRQIIARIDPDGTSALTGELALDDSWTITNYMRRRSLGVWLQVGEREEWRYPFAPIFTCQNLPNPNETWGMPDLTPDLIGQNTVLNFIQSNTARIIKFHGHPRTYATGLSATQINIGVEDLICLPSPDSKLANLEMSGNLADQLQFASIIRGDMDEQSRVPAIALGRESSLPHGSTLSGIAVKLLFQPLIEKTVQKQRLYGSMIRAISRAALVLAGMIAVEEYEDYPIDLHWQSLLPADDLQAAQTGLVYEQLGVSKHTVLSMLDFDADDEEEKRASEQADTMVQASRGREIPPSEEMPMDEQNMPHGAQ